MFIRLPDFYYTSQPVFGHQPPMNRMQSAGPAVYQGTDIEFGQYVELGGAPVDHTKFELIFVVKKSEQAVNVLIRSTLTVNPDVPGLLTARIPKETSALLRPGVYYFAVQGVETATQRVFLLRRGTFTVLLSALAPNPQLPIGSGELTADADMQTSTSQIGPVEPSHPRPPKLHLG